MYVGLYHRSHGSCVKGIGRSGLQYRSKPRNRDGEWDRGRENDSADMRHTQHTITTLGPVFGYFQATAFGFGSGEMVCCPIFKSTRGAYAVVLPGHQWDNG